MPTSEPENVAGRVRQKPNAPAERFAFLPSTWMNPPGNAREMANLPEFAKAQRERRNVEVLFPELKNQIGLRRLRLRRLKFVREQFFLAAAQNLRRLVRFLNQPTMPTGQAVS